jgi:hypothetical protein
MLPHGDVTGRGKLSIGGVGKRHGATNRQKVFTMRQFLLAASLMITMSSLAQAEITLTRVENEGGVLVVRGETSQRNQLVTVDGRYRTRTDRYKEFRFRIRYLPRDCSIKIRAGQEERPARIANCDMVLPLRPHAP